MAEQQRNNEGHVPDEDVSMDEILTSLRNILEEEDSEEGSEGSQGQSAPVEADQPSGAEAEGGEELVLTDVVAEGDDAQESEPPPAAAPSALDQELGTTPPEGTGEGEFDALFGRWDREEDAAEAPEPTSTAEPEMATETEPASPEPEAVEPEAPEPEVPAGAEVAGSEPEAAAPEEPAVPEQAFELGDSTSPLSDTPEAEALDQQPAAPVEPEAPSIDTEAVRETVETTVREQVEQATSDLDNRLAAALEPKIREALQGYLEERLPGLLRELAETEIERIKKGE